MMDGFRFSLQMNAAELVADAKTRVENLSMQEVETELLNGALLIDIRDVRERERLGAIPGAMHVPRGMLEFWVDPDSSHYREYFTVDRRTILYCAGGGRSALAADTLRKMGFSRVAHLECGFNGWRDAGGPVENVVSHRNSMVGSMVVSTTPELPGDEIARRPGPRTQSRWRSNERAIEALAIGVLGGTGPQGRGLARRFAMSGLNVVVGSRSSDRAHAVAASIGHGICGADNRSVAETADVVIVAVPWEGHDALLTELQSELAGKIVVDCVNPLGFDERGAFALPVAEGSAAQRANRLLPGSHVTAAFHHVSAVVLEDLNADTVDTDVLVLGDDRAATDIVQSLASLIPGMRGIYGGRLRNAHQVEAFTANLISINKRYRAHAGVRVTDVDD